MTPLSLEPCSYLTRFVTTEVNGRTVDQAYVVARYVAINVKISVSLFEVESSKPGVSIRTTRRPSMVNSSASCTSVVHDFKRLPTRRLELLAMLTN